MACTLLSGVHGLLAQVVLCALALGSLMAKRLVEKPRRPLPVWSFDVSKQAFAAAAAHGCGMLWAVLMAKYTEEGASECAWYMVVFTLDTTVGVAVALYLHTLVTVWAKRLAASPVAFPLPLIHTAADEESAARKLTFVQAVAQCGNYGDPPSAAVFMPQMLEFVSCVVVGRVTCGLLVWVGAGALGMLARGIDGAAEAGFPADAAAAARAELWGVMVLGPVSMNVVQALVQDAYLKFKVRLGSGPAAHSALDDFASSGRELSDHLLSEHNPSGGGGGGGGGGDDAGETAVPISRMPRAMSPAEKRRSHSASLSRLLGE